MRKSAVYEGSVMHRRLRPLRRRFQYRVFSFLISLDELDALDHELKLFSRNRFNLFSFFDQDFGHGKPADIIDEVRESLAALGVEAGGEILLLCYPRILGYAFNPLAVYYCHNRDGTLAAMIYEVRNTFGGRHSYVIPVEDAGQPIRQEADKTFHVSPFIDMNMRYRFHVTRPESAISIGIHESDAEGGVLNAAFVGRRRPMSDRSLMRLFFAYPLMTLKVIAGIHWEAAKLLASGLSLRRGPGKPAQPVELVKRGG